MNWENIILFFEQAVFWFGTVVAAASVIIKATPTQKDDAVLAKIIKVLDLVSIVNAKIQENKETSQKEKMLPDGMGIIGAVAVLLAALLSFFAYKFGRAQEKIDHEREKSKTAAYIRSLRRRLDNSDIVERLHDTFKR